jgi:hypothetical protein
VEEKSSLSPMIPKRENESINNEWFVKEPLYRTNIQKI